MLDVALPVPPTALRTAGTETPTGSDDAAPASDDERARPRRGGSAPAQRGGWRKLLGHTIAAAECVALVAAVGWAADALHGAYLHGQSASTVVPGVEVGGFKAEGLTRTDLGVLATAVGVSAASRPIELRAGPVTTQETAVGLGAVPWPSAAVDQALAVGRTGDPLVDLSGRLEARRGHIDIPIGYQLDEERGLERLLALAPRVETPSLPTALDFDARKVVPARRGTTLLAYDSLSAVAVALAQGAAVVDLAVQDKPPVEDPLQNVVEDLDISVVLGSFDTPYKTDATAGDRTHNLKVGATSIDARVLLPGEVFSFNETVGERSAEAGYRYATGISGGELVDVLGGGICQVSSTIFGAGFFGGLGVVSARPHSRPSSYVDMGLDSTVVWPSVDMKLRNDYDFPVVLHMTVSQGKVRAEVLGPRRPYQVAFERQLDTVLPYKSIIRDDGRLLAGTTQLAQRGRRGFKVKRRRKLLQAGEVVGTQEWELTYPATTEITRRGTSATGTPGEKKTLPTLRDPAPQLKIVQ